MTIDFEDSFNYTHNIHKLIWEQLKTTFFPGDARSFLLLTYVAVALEHQESIYKLVESNLRGSAFALLRSQVEATFRGLWAYGLATDEQIHAISQEGGEPFPTFRKMRSEEHTSELQSLRHL